ncbi:cation diffusion facilitator family transporter [Stieleria sp. TO1_6]|uniref:cation diffusion facilitator family transporter n=1 Tax=Stieleria tagensis TaxID=2956795 RepID=UPI00209B6AB6|nr:cation diffusion facilitator family transporter [Stieleria tagensis]MCO8125525.1 cation diffusion facilitator family transporter [Stieleria tagensis]
MSLSPPRDEASIAVRDRVYVDAKRAAIWGLSVNVVLVVAKLAGGMLLRSSALVADAVNSIGDVTSSVTVRVALHVAEREEDEDHPYGHTKAESIAGFAVSLLVMFGAGVLAFETIKQFAQPKLIPHWSAGLIAAVCCVVKETVYRYTSQVANRLNSAALRATALDHRSDAIASAAIALSLFAAPYLGELGPYVDPIAAVCVCALLILTSAKMFLSIAAELMDQQADPETIQRVRDIAGEVDQVKEIEKLRVRKSGLEYFIEIHVQVDGQLTVDQGHRIGHEVKDRLLAKMPRVRDVHLHVEPWDEE